MVIQEVVFLIVGIAIMAFTLIWGTRLGNRQVELGFGKLGFNIRADGLPLIFLLGFLMAGVGVFFRYRNYESEAKTLRDDLGQVTGERNMLTDELQGFKNYDLGLNLVFPREVDPRGFIIQVHTKKMGDQNFSLRTDLKAETDIGGTWVNVNRLSRGEKIKIVAQGADSSVWVAEDLEIPKTQLRMMKQ
jgi:hypothetical protein